MIFVLEVLFVCLQSLQIQELECAVETLTLQVIGQQQDAAEGACTRGNLEIQVRDLQEQLQELEQQADADLARAQQTTQVRAASSGAHARIWAICPCFIHIFPKCLFLKQIFPQIVVNRLLV